MPQNEVVTLPQRPGAGHSIADIEKLAEAVARSRMFGIQTKEQALVLMAISQAEGRHPALAARDYNIINGRPAKTSEAMMRDFISAGGRVEWHQLSDDVADATFTHPAGGTIRILWDTSRAAKAGLAGKEMWKKYSRQMMRSRCVSEGVRTVCPSATSGFYVPEEVRDMPAATALPEAAADTTADLDQFAAVTGDPEPPEVFDLAAEMQSAAERGMTALQTLWEPLSAAEKRAMKPQLETYKAIARAADAAADDPFGLPPLPAAEPVTEPEQPVVARDVFAELDHEARAATKEGIKDFEAWWKTLRQADKDLLRAFQGEYQRLAHEADAQRGLAI